MNLCWIFAVATISAVSACKSKVKFRMNAGDKKDYSGEKKENSGEKMT